MSHIVVIGAGVTGLQSAISLLTSPLTSNYKITIIASHFPGDVSTEYASPWAGGDWRSSASLSSEDAEVRDWDKKTYDQWMNLLESAPREETTQAKEQRLGIGKRTIRYFWGIEDTETANHDGSGLWWQHIVQDFRVINLDSEAEVPRGAIFGIEFQSICLNVPRYLEVLLERARSLGAMTIRGQIQTGNGIVGVVRDAKRMVGNERAEQDSRGTVPVDILINCMGLSAQKFVSKEEAGKIYPIRGQTVLVKGEAKKGRSYTKIPGTDDQEVLYVIPRPGSGTTVLGGCKQAGDWNGEVDDALGTRILDRVKREGLAEELRTGKGGGFEIVSSQVGLRPGRQGGPRVELDRNSRWEQTWIVHAYGHAGAGYQNSIGSAEKIVEIVGGLT